jgi:hypothetical protein
LDPKTTYLEAEEKILSGSTRLCPILSKRSFTSEALTKRIRLTIGLSVVFLGSLSAHGFCAQASSAAKKRLDAELLRLELGTRIEQRCNKHAMDTVRREHRPMDPDEGVVAAFGEPEEDGSRLHADGAAIRSRGDWYHLGFDCVTSADGLDIKAFRYFLGPAVPRTEWREHNLVTP